MPSIDCKTMPIEKAIRIFRRKCDNAGIKEECRARQHYLKPSAIKYEHNKLSPSTMLIYFSINTS